MRWGRPHQGIDFAGPMGAGVGAAGRGLVSFAGYNSGGFGNLVVIDHRLGFQTYYAHLSSVSAWRGQAVTGGTRIGYLGSTGYVTGPNLHFEVRLNGTPIDPMSRLLASTASAAGNVATGALLNRTPGSPGCDRQQLQTLARGAGARAVDRC